MTDQIPAFSVACPSCHSRLKVRDRDLGSTRVCPRCRGTIQIPGKDDAERQRKVQHAKAEYPFRCHLCGTTLYAHVSQQGTTISCPDCDSPNLVPGPPAVRKRTVVVEDSDLYQLQAESHPKHTPANDAALIRATCRVCECMMYAREDQIGKSIPCLDCGAPVFVRKPPAKRPVVVREADPGIEIAAAHERAEEKPEVDRYIEQGREYAERVIAGRPKPPRRPFWNGIYRFPFYLNILPRWIGLSVLVMMSVPFSQIAADAKGIASIIVMPLFIAFAFLSTIVAFFVSTMWISIAQRTAAGYDVVDEWPLYDFFERIRCVMFILSPFIVTTAPFLLLGRIPYLGWPALGLGVLSVMFLYPVAFLSMADKNSPATPYSATVWQSLVRIPKDWATFYLAATPAWLGLFGIVALAIYWPSEWIVGSIGVAFIVFGIIAFRLMGRMAWVISQKVPLEWNETGEYFDDER